VYGIFWLKREKPEAVPFFTSETVDPAGITTELLIGVPKADLRQSVPSNQKVELIPFDMINMVSETFAVAPDAHPGREEIAVEASEVSTGQNCARKVVPEFFTKVFRRLAGTSPVTVKVMGDVPSRLY